MDDSLIEGSPGAGAVNTSASPSLNVSWLSACGHPYLCPVAHVGAAIFLYPVVQSSGPAAVGVTKQSLLSSFTMLTFLPDK